MTVVSTLESSAVATVKIHDFCSNYYKCEVEKIRKCMTIDCQRSMASISCLQCCKIDCQFTSGH